MINGFGNIENAAQVLKTVFSHLKSQNSVVYLSNLVVVNYVLHKSLAGHDQHETFKVPNFKLTTSETVK